MNGFYSVKKLVVTNVCCCNSTKKFFKSHCQKKDKLLDEDTFAAWRAVYLLITKVLHCIKLQNR